MIHVYGLSPSAQRQVDTATQIAESVSSPNAASVDGEARFLPKA